MRARRIAGSLGRPPTAAVRHPARDEARHLTTRRASTTATVPSHPTPPRDVRESALSSVQDGRMIFSPKDHVKNKTGTFQTIFSENQKNGSVIPGRPPLCPLPLRERACWHSPRMMLGEGYATHSEPAAYPS